MHQDSSTTLTQFEAASTFLVLLGDTLHFLLLNSGLAVEGYPNKTPQTRWLKNTEFCCLTALEASKSMLPLYLRGENPPLPLLSFWQKRSTDIS